mmetsp:Transcript_31292/g.93748  ORF Transcript_31292/g.93748 Transcript_31292/m.93748 type:complete len:311 (-) Transcript_31292:192-1124(-)
MEWHLPNRPDGVRLLTNTPVKSCHGSIKKGKALVHDRRPFPKGSFDESRDPQATGYRPKENGGAREPSDYHIGVQASERDIEVFELKVKIEQMQLQLQAAEEESEYLKECLAKEHALDRTVLDLHDISTHKEKVAEDFDDSSLPNTTATEEKPPLSQTSKSLLFLCQSILQLTQQRSGSQEESNTLDIMEQAMESMADHLDFIEHGIEPAEEPARDYGMLNTSFIKQAQSPVIHVRRSLAERIFHIVNVEVCDKHEKEEAVGEEMTPVGAETFISACQILVNERDEVVQGALDLVENAKGEAVAKQRVFL